MKRPVYEIRSNHGHSFTKSAWNASIRSIEAAVREAARAEGVTYELQASRSTKDESGGHVFGHRIWRSPAKTLVFTISLIGETK